MNGYMPEISVIMGVFNNENSVEKAIQSIIDQTFTNWEFIICNDGSTDNTHLRLVKYQADPRFRIIKNNKNMGLGAALNKCICHCKGQFLARQDADDYSSPDRLARQLEYLKSNKHITVLGTQIRLFDSRGHHWGIYAPLSPDDPWEWVKGSKVVHASVLMRADFIREIGGYDSRVVRAEDYEMWIRVLSNKGVIKTIPELLYNVHRDWHKYKSKHFRFRLMEISVFFKGLKLLKINRFKSFYVIKYILTSIIPARLIYHLHRRRFSKENQFFN